jgi:hypothetical protein
MSPDLRKYILRNLGPSNLRLELVERLDNLCSLSGTPMSPDLREWVIRTFGLEMVRILESYSSLTPPVFSPELQQKINRIVPSNYQGYDANLGFNQLFDVSCCDNFRYAVIGSYNGTSNGFGGWTINGLDFLTFYQADFASAGCNTNIPYTNASFPVFGTYEIIVWYYGTNDPVFNILNDTSDPVVLNWKSLCSKTCYETIVPQAGTLISSFDVMGPEFLNYVEPKYTFFFGNPDVSVPADVSAIQSYYQQCCGAATTVTSITDINGDYVVTISNAYMPFAPFWITGLGPVFFNEITCP